ncbi:cell division control protein Cdc6 [Haloferax mediterranei ATCC 33500]|uniref:ORC1-type DNA replication protein n=1 Tax=Haloferax mediterranei (strain ATCC 33500 / DSM 1411 / JCM 8866 / NBRC 14739 / NCIMB 2177 / R-4) TaxID=523841 RepID=I3R6G9_HALMT|nr:orc1/cdc6 family replication initiation protein [Haloferax mediterranei]AFK19829.1 cell division control protein cdc6-like protein [Haloferax mediterranei ATCC 33500]AHZ23212.1 cell division control protein Cdc6 [Haloferax mediterranei ATCC 33500]ELZ99794.1 cell division control protein cdc6-like protein [Haloferax mediterranei ATCC 33500]MDX5987422.1 orc1/cdc6 family replication initiation protein [Haloferax mediterranei ATCC 33500]QCQ73925.1 cell division control protein Cdc6 [Haloferax m
MSEGYSDADLFSTGDIFARRELLRVGHVPDRDRIVGRDSEMRQVGSALGPATNGGPPRNLIAFGKTGTGKSLVSRHICRRARKHSKKNGVNLRHVYVDCSDADTETRVARELALQMRDELAPSTDIPVQGIGASEYYRYLWTLLDDVDVFVVILDEIDKLGDDDVLMQLSRAEESGKTDTYVGVISISNKIEYREQLNERVNSSLQDRELTFHPYDAPQLEEILENRRDAFLDGVLHDDVIPKTAALAAREHGDARKAVDILFEAGSLAEEHGDSEVTSQHVDDAQQRTEVKRFQDLVSGSTPHVKYILRALALLTLNSDDQQFSTSDIHRLYERLAEKEGSDPLSHDRVYRLLKEQSFLGITESYHTGGGASKGAFLQHRLMKDPEIVIEALDSGEKRN